MGCSIVVGVQEPCDPIRFRLRQELSYLEDEGLHTRIRETAKGNLVFLECHLLENDSLVYSGDDMQMVFRHYMANVLAGVITNEMEPQIVHRIVADRCGELTTDEQERIEQIAIRSLASEYLFGHVPLTGGNPISRRNRVLRSVSQFLEQESEIIVDGFVRFRLKDYLRELEDAVDHAFDEILVEHEYREFIRLLRYFVEVQEPRVDLVHVMIQPNGSFRLLDDSGQSIRSDPFETTSLVIGEKEINYEDLLISALITVAPSKVLLHTVADPQRVSVVGTILTVFENRVEICTGCPLCQPTPSLSEPLVRHDSTELH